jgi:hypothetical protein
MFRMIFKKSLGMLGSVCVVAALSGGASMAVAADAPAKPAAAVVADQKLSLLDGKLPFTLKGFEERPVPGGAPGKMYFSAAEKRVLIVGEEPIPLIARGGTEDDFLEGGKTIKDQQKASSPDYKVTSEKTENVNGLKVHHIEATSVMGGNKVLQATLLSAANKKFAVIQVISNWRDTTGHAKAVNDILGK